LNASKIDISVDLTDIVGWTAHVMLDQAATFHDAYLGHSVTHLDAHEMTTNGATIAFTTTATFDDFSIDIGAKQALATLSGTGTGFATTTATAFLLGRAIC
jgi:hypothetical protein